MRTPGDAQEGVVGLLLAAGSGRRMGRPKALLTDAAGQTWLARAVTVLRDGGCAAVYVVLGAEAEEVRRHVPPDAEVVVPEEWAEGMGASLRAGLSAVDDGEPGASAVVVMLVDTPGVAREVVRRLVSSARDEASGVVSEGLASALARTSYHGRPGHPVLMGRDHWPGVMASARGDRGARDYLGTRNVSLVECGDIGSGEDIDDASALQRWRDSGSWGR